MSNKRISELEVAGTITGAELIAVVQNGATRQTTVTTVLNFTRAQIVATVMEILATHATQHAKGGSDPVSISAIGVGETSVENDSRALLSTDNGRTLVCPSTRMFTVNTGMPTGFGVAAKGACTFVGGTATVTDVRTTVDANPWCALVYTGIDTYDIVGTAVEDEDFLAYVAAVEAADGQALESDVKSAIGNFIIGCKSDNIWDAIKASCILAGARTLSGALVPLKGAPPTNNNLSNYDREIGLLGNFEHGAPNYLNSNRSNAADPQNSKHVSVYVTEWATPGIWNAMLGSGQDRGHTVIGYPWNSLTKLNLYTNSEPFTEIDDITIASACLMGVQRSNPTQLVLRYGAVSNTIELASATPVDSPIYVFKVDLTGVATNNRMTFYSIGEGIDLEKLESRVAQMLADFSAAIA